MVFSDGEDLNSGYKGDVVSQAAKGVPDLHVFAVDCMPGPKMDDFMGTFASQNMGQARKTAAAADLLPMFEKLATKLEHFYVVTYAFAPPPAPVAAAPAPRSPKRVAFNQAALFDFDKAELKPAGKEELKGYYEKTKAELSSAQSVKITGHTDNVGSHDYNMKLSKRRAQAVRDYLVSIGVDASKMEVDGEGETQPVADNSTREGRAKNRRVEIEVSGLSH
jgi:OOP family OmpA-OmpF porin